MNERIGTLLNRSGGEFYEGFLGSPNTIKFTEEELATFVDLIVRECISIAQRQRDPANLNYKPSERFVEDLQRHFGVKE